MKVGAAELIIPNDVVFDTRAKKNRLARNALSDLINEEPDYVQIWRDSVLDWAGEMEDIDYGDDTIIIPCVSHIDKLNEQYTENETFTEEPATTVKRFLKGWGLYLADNFNLGSIGSDWVYESPWTVTSSKLHCPNTSNAYKYCYWDTNFTDWADTKITLDYSSYKSDDYDADVNLHIFWDYQDANNNMFLKFRRRDRTFYADAIQLGFTSGGTPDQETIYFKYPVSSAYRVKVTSSTSGGTTTFNLWLDGALIGTHSGTYTPSSSSKFRLEATSNEATDWNKADNLEVKFGKQIISEGSINNFGSSKTTKVSYETLLNAIHERICPQCASADNLADHWEWRENPVEYVDATTPCASLNFGSRIGSDKDNLLSVDEKNIKGFRSRRSKRNYSNIAIAIGAGTSEMDLPGQNVARAIDLTSANTFGRIRESLWQLSDEQDADILQALADIWVGKRSSIHENIQVDPIDYETQGFTFGDAYLMNIEKLKITPDTYYRIKNEMRAFTQEGAETITINWKDEELSFRDEVRYLFRQLTNKARYGQGTYIVKEKDYSVDSVGASAYSPYRYFMLDPSMYLRIKKVTYSVGTSCTAWSIYIDDVDRTMSLFGVNFANGDKKDFDITRYISQVGVNHSIRLWNNTASTYNLNTWGEAEVYIR